MIHVIATVTLKPGVLDAVAAAATPLIEATRKEAGCLRYDLLVDILDRTRMTFVEEWESREALEAHFHAPHIAAWAEASRPYVASARVAIVHPERTELL